MLFIQILVLAAVLAAAAGIFALHSVLCDVRAHLLQSNKMIGQQMEGLFGGYYEASHFDVANDLRKIAKFAEDARNGLIPNLRYDDWHATEEDIRRWEDAAILAAARSE